MKFRRVAITAIGALAAGSLSLAAAAPAFASEPGREGPAGNTGSVATTTTSRGREVTSYLDELASKVRQSAADEPTKALLLERLAATKAAFQAGNPPSNADMQQLIREVFGALGVPLTHDEPTGTSAAPRPAPGGSSSTTETDRSTGDRRGGESTDDRHHAADGSTSTERPRPANAVDAIDRARDLIEHANLDPAARQRALDALDRARQEAETQLDAGGDGQAAIAAHLEARLTELRGRLTKIAGELNGLAEQAAAAHPDDARLAAARAALHAATEAIAAAETPAELRAVWAQLRDARSALQSILGAAPPTTTTTTATTTTAAATTA